MSFPKTTGGKEEPNIVFRENRTSHQEWNEYELNKTQHKKTKKMTNEPSCSWREGKQFMFLIWHPQCYSYSQIG